MHAPWTLIIGKIRCRSKFFPSIRFKLVVRAQFKHLHLWTYDACKNRTGYDSQNKLVASWVAALCTVLWATDQGPQSNAAAEIKKLLAKRLLNAYPQIHSASRTSFKDNKNMKFNYTHRGRNQRPHTHKSHQPRVVGNAPCCKVLYIRHVTCGIHQSARRPICSTSNK